MKALPTWLRTHLEDKTGLDYTTASGIYAKARHCRACSAQILSGQCGDPGWLVHIDPTPLTAQQETACLLTGRMTFTLFESGAARRIEIVRRDQFSIRGHPPDTATVVPTHQCGARFPDPPREPARTYLTDPDAPAPF